MRHANSECMNDSTIALLNKVLDGASLRHQAISANIANANTKGYQRRDVHFMNELREAIASGNPDGLAKVKPKVEKDKGNAPVRLEAEFAALSQNHLLYMSSADILARKYSGLRKAIKGQ